VSEDRRRLPSRLSSLYEAAIKQSLWGIARVDLGLSRTFEATIHPALLVSYRPAGAREEIAPGTPIITIYDKAGDGLLILGKPGAGKSMLLYELALLLRSSLMVRKRNGL
jgi:stage III sporulation protein SpoIIIAA